MVVESTLPERPQPLQFVLDSGAGETLLARRVADEAGIPASGQERIRTVGGTRNASRAGTLTFRFGATERFSANPLVVDLTAESRALGSQLDGLLGADFFQGRVIQIDFRKSVLCISPVAKPSAGAVRVPMKRSDGAFFVTLDAGESRLTRVRLDTGCNRSLCWTPPLNARGFWRDGATSKIDVGLGSTIIPAVAADIYREPLFAGEDGLLGLGFLSRFDSVWIDAVNGRVIFESAAR